MIAEETHQFLNEKGILNEHQNNIGIGTQLDRILKLLIQRKGMFQSQDLQELNLPQKLYEFAQLHFKLIKEQMVPFINLHFFNNIVKEPTLFAQYAFKTKKSSRKNCRVDLAISESVENKLVIVEFKYSQKPLNNLLKLYKIQLQKYLCIPDAVAVVLYNLNKFEGTIITMHSFQTFSCDFQNKKFLFKFELPIYFKKDFIQQKTCPLKNSENQQQHSKDMQNHIDDSFYDNLNNLDSFKYTQQFIK